MPFRGPMRKMKTSLKPSGPIGGMGSTFNASSHISNVIADGDNLIFSYNTPGSKGTTYFCFKNINVRDFCFNLSPGDIPQGTLDFNFFDSESKSFDIPNHIPKEQHTKYIKEQFDLDQSTK